jgi:hypothetical protein
MSNTADKTGGKPIAVWSQISGVNGINPLVAFSDMHKKKLQDFQCSNFFTWSWTQERTV